jgi:hypothetical protein
VTPPVTTALRLCHSLFDGGGSFERRSRIRRIKALSVGFHAAFFCLLERYEVDVSGIADVNLLRYANVLLLRAKAQSGHKKVSRPSQRRAHGGGERTVRLKTISRAISEPSRPTDLATESRLNSMF